MLSRSTQNLVFNLPKRHFSKSLFNLSNLISKHQNSLNVHNWIQANTEISRDHLTPEIQLHLITPRCESWYKPAEECEISDPFWAFYWPGGQALTRFIFDNTSLVRGKSVLDVGSGCGASAIAACMAGARSIVANDIDKAAIDAINLNSNLNKVSIPTNTDNLVGKPYKGLDVVFLGDMFYDEEFTEKVSSWIQTLLRGGATVFIGDPGRIYLKQHALKKQMKKMFEVELMQNSKEENYGLTHGYVWQVIPDR